MCYLNSELLLSHPQRISINISLKYLWPLSLTWCAPTFSSGCKRSMNHLKEGLDHEAKHRCRYSAQYDNRIYTCKASTSPKISHACVEICRLDAVLSVCAELLRPAMREGRR